MAKINAGDEVPDVTVMLNDGAVRLRDFTGRRNVVLYFYPKDGSYVCVLEARAFNDQVDAFAAMDTVVIGVSMDSRASHARFAAKEKLRFSLGTDPDHVLVNAFDASNRLVLGIAAKRVTFLLGKDGHIARVWDTVNPLTHSRDVLDAVQALVEAGHAVA